MASKAQQNVWRNKKRARSFPIGEGFLSPEQQHLLRMRRKAERRNARHRQARVIFGLVVVAGLTALCLWLLDMTPAWLPEWMP